MTLNRVPPSFGRAVAADDALQCNHPSQIEARSQQRRGSGAVRSWRATGVIALVCCAPGFMFGQHRGYRGSGSHDSLSTLSCTSGSLTGAGTDACTVTLTSATSSAMTVNLTSSSSAVKVPASVTVASGASSAAFTATASAVTSTQTATLKASASSNSETYSLQLKAASTGTAGLTLGSTSVAFGSVSLNSPATQ